MNHFRNSGSSVSALLISITGLLIYLYGFFSFNQSLGRTYRRDENNDVNRQRYLDKLAIIVVDSLRYDFVSSKEKRLLMPFTTHSILNNKSCLVTMKASSPTVTMPRIKAMTSGAASNYIDVVLNLMSSDFEEDNFITKAVSHQLKVVFYGDNTWLKLFPKAFYRSEGTTSFFVLDFTEVDENVTRHIDNELEKNDWDIIILHYLGLDHIGHVEGPESHLVPPKLKEMDNVVKKISNHFKLIEKRDNVKTMVLLTSDHGMKDSGGHGGVTYAEVTVPLVSVGSPCKVLPGWPESYTALQVDLAPTLCTLFGLSLPMNSVGKIIPNILYWISDEEIIKNLEHNKNHLLKLSGSFNKELKHSSNVESNKESTSKNGEDSVSKKIKYAKYFEDLNTMSEHLVRSKSEFKNFHLFLGLMLLWSPLFILIYKLSWEFQKPRQISEWCLLLGFFLHGLSFSSSSFIEEEHQTWYFLWVTLCILIIVEIVHERNTSFLRTLKSSLPWIAICFTHRILRKLNQTGDKWAFLPDIKAFLTSVDGQLWLLVSFITGLLLIYGLAAVQHHSKWQSFIFGLSLFCIFSYRLSTGTIKLKFLESYPPSKGATQVLFIGLFTLLYTCQTVYWKTQKYLIWLLLASLLLRPYNVILLPIQVFFSKTIHRHFNEERLIWNNMAHIWLGNLFYFYQGNGNSLANVDVAPAFLGISTYNSIYAAIMVACHTFNGQIFGFILSPQLDLIWTISRLVPLAFYCTFLMFQLHHLFIWSVFSPKLLYESSLTLLFFILITIRHVLESQYKNKTQKKC